MGLIVENKQSKLKMTYGSFFQLRKTIAGIMSAAFADLYDDWITGKIDDNAGNKELQRLVDTGEISAEYNDVVKFLFASDIEGSLPVKTARQINQLIKDYDGELCGYEGTPPDCIHFYDFREMVKQSVKNRWVISWY